MLNFWLRRRRRAALLRQPFPDRWERLLRESVRQFAAIPSNLQRRVRDVTTVMVAEKDWVGAGIEATEAMKVIVAGHAGLLACGQSEPYFFDRLQSIIIHPRTIRFSPAQTQRYSALPDFPADGIAFEHGPVLLSWGTVRAELAGRSPGRNVILHELAHHVDGLVQGTDGVPGVGDRRRYDRWLEVTKAEYLRLAAAARRREPTLLDYYGATSPAEFFAVATEYFFELPHAVHHEHPELYEVLADFYRLDPASWTLPKRAPGDGGARPRRRSVFQAAPTPTELPRGASQSAGLTDSDRARLRALGSMSEADALYTLALGHLAANPPRASDAERILTSLLATDPADEEALAHRARAWHLLGDDNAAMTDAAAALALDPADPDALEIRARIYLAAGKSDAALADLNAALRELPGDVELLVLRGDAQAALSHWYRAIGDYGAAIVADPLHVAALRGRAAAWEAAGHHGRAERDRRTAELLAARP